MTNLINIENEMTGLVDEARTKVSAYVDFSKVVDTVFHKILINKLSV